ncbi:CorA metal ion transporter (MIT) family protein [Pleurotus pulmonarius]|nr:hypothetical protein EYR36_008066 [Pleurotus pulmonarius]
MPRENSFSDSEGRSLTPDLSDLSDHEDFVASPISLNIPGGGIPDVTHIQSPIQRVASPARSHHTHRTARSQAVSSVAHRVAMSPKERFRKVVRKVIALHRSTSTFSYSRFGVGDEPGIDPRRDSAYINWGHIQQDCLIQVNDYSSLRSSFGMMTNNEFIGMMQSDAASERESWVKVRWINIAGISWDVLSAVALRYDMHPLALEDVLHQRDQSRSKADYYHKHLFLRVLCHELLDPDDDSTYIPPHAAVQRSHNLHPARGSTLTEIPRSTSPAPFTPEDREHREHQALENSLVKGDVGITVEGAPNGEFGTVKAGDVDRDNTLFGTETPSKRRSWRRTKSAMSSVMDVEKAVPPPKKVAFQKHEKHNKREGRERTRLAKYAESEERHDERKQAERNATIEELKRGERVNVKVYPMFMFLYKDGTFITIHPSPDATFTDPIVHRLRQPDTLLRKSADASLLLQSMLDLIVDQALEVIDAYHYKIKKFERDILLKPKMKTVRNLHILSGDLILHKRTLEPIKTIVYGLRRYDQDRCAALAEANSSSNGKREPVVGFMTHKSQIYLADVYDHMAYILTSLEMFAGIAENLIDYTFNMASYEMNEVMRRLTLATIIFLPLTLLTGYFGMNFEFMWTIQHGHSDLIFWIIALPVMAVVLPMFIAPDIVRIVHYCKKKMTAQRAKRSVKDSYKSA